MENVALIESIGAYLKSLREQKKITLEKVSEKTRIKVRLLEDIENNVFTNLGGTGYAKAMIINYARNLGADEEKILHLFDEQMNQKPKFVPHVKSIQPKKLIIPPKIFLFFLLIIVIIALTYLVIHLYKNNVQVWPPFKKTEQKTETAKKVETPVKPQTFDLQEKSDELKEVEQSTINESVLRDTTDYLNEFMFKDKESPFNFDE
jgi:cytoskeletal protein RodZ